MKLTYPLATTNFTHTPYEFVNLVQNLFSEPFWNSLSNCFVNSDSQQWTDTGMKTNLYSENNDLILQSDIPGVTSEEIDLSVKDNVLTIHAETKKPKDENAKEKKQRRHRNYYGTIALPAGSETDKIGADYRDGVLTIRIPKSKKQEPKQITVACQ